MMFLKFPPSVCFLTLVYYICTLAFLLTRTHTHINFTFFKKINWMRAYASIHLVKLLVT